MSRRRGEIEETDKLTRIAIVNADKCKPKRCRQECKKSCPVVRMGKLCIEVIPNSKIAVISEELCIGCGICVKKCPFEAINIINLPSNLHRETTHRYGKNSFKLHRLPIPRPGEVLGLVGTNGIGKSTALKILAGKQKPNLGRYMDPPDWTEILNHFRGSELQNYFTKILEDDLKALIKPQYVDQIPKAVKGTVGQLLNKKDELENQDEICDMLDLKHIKEREISALSGGELQRFACAMVCIQNGDIFMFDEPSSYLDVKQRLNAAQTIRSLLHPDKFIIVVEHDLSVLDYLSDFICCLYGVPGAYGVVTMPFSVREGINIFLDGFVPTENLRFRDESLVFKVAESATEEEVKRMNHYEYPAMSKTMGNFKLNVKQGQFSDSEILVLLGENGTGKTTFIRMLAGNLEPDSESGNLPQLHISYKPQPTAENIILEVTEKDFSDNEEEKPLKSENRTISLQEIDSPDLVNIEDYKIDDHRYASTSENIEERCMVTLSEASYDSEISIEKQENILEGIPNEILVYTCQPVDSNELNRYPCKACNSVVGCIFCLKSHYESIHLNLGIIQYKCEQTTYLKNYTEICHKCNLVCESKDEMIEHRKIHFVTCDVCDMSFDSALFLSNHCKTAHEKFEVIISCDLCDQWFKQLNLLSDHYESFHEMILCIVCFKRFSSRNELEQHHNTHSIVLRNTGSLLPYACSKCNQAFAEISDLSAHLSREHSKRKTDSNSVNSKVKAVKLLVESICDTACDKAKAKYLEDMKHKRLKKIPKGED